MLGWIVWGIESALCVIAGYAAACAIYPDRGVLERLLAGGLITSALVIVATTGCGVVSMLEPVTLGLFALSLCGLLLYASARTLGGARALWTSVSTSLAPAPGRFLRDTIAQREVAVLTLLPAAMAFGICAQMAWYMRSWTWDPVWYHDPKIYIAIQEQSLRWFDTPNPWTQGNPQNGELFSLWNCIFPRDNRLDDSAQLPFLWLGAVAVAAWARRVGASRPLSVAVGATWVALPPVFLQGHSTHVDIIWHTLFVAAVFYMLAWPTRRDRWLAFTAWGLFLGSKYTGLFHLGLLSPLILARAGYEVWQEPRGKRLVRVADVVASGLWVVVLGGHKYIQNALNAGNPMWPFVLRIKLLGLDLPGTADPSTSYGAKAGETAAFFGAPNALTHMLTTWLNSDPFFAPDVGQGGFGPVFRWLLVPCVFAIAFDLLRGRSWKRSALVVLLFVQAVLVPYAHLPRFVLAASSAALVAFALVHSQTRSRWVRALLSIALVALTWRGYRDAYRGFIVYPRYFEESRGADPITRTAMQIDTFLWPRKWALLREQELNAGDVLAYDESVHFLGELWNHDFDARVVFVSQTLAPEAYMARLRALRAKWVGVQSGSANEAALRTAGAEFLFETPDSSMVMYRLPAS